MGLKEIKIEKKEHFDLSGVFVVLQPKMNLHDGTIESYEALARMLADDVVISPDQFFKTAIANGTESELNWMIIDKVIEASSLIKEKTGHQEKIAFNVTPEMLSENCFVNYIEYKVQEHELSYEQFEIELTESSSLDISREMAEKLEHFKAKGMSIAIDDFGAGYSSVARLDEIPANVVKLDKIFADKINDNYKTFVIVKGICDMSKALGIKVVAEGIEDAETNQKMFEAGVDVAQGYLFSKPIEVNQVIEKKGFNRLNYEDSLSL